MAAATVRSYVVPDSDDEAIADEADFGLIVGQAKKKKVESNLQRWIKHLSILLKEEQKKVNIAHHLPSTLYTECFLQFKEKKKRMEKSAPPDSKIRIPKVRFRLSSKYRSVSELLVY